MTFPSRRSASSRGSALVEFALTSFLMVMMMFAVVEMQRMLLVYTTLSNSARVGARYAITHGASRTGTGTDGPSGPNACTSGTAPAQVATVINNFASAGLLTTSGLTITACYPNGTNNPGDPVKVNVKYTYDPIVSWFTPLQVTLGSTSWGRITF